MAADDQSIPIVYAIHVPTGELRHVKDVANGKACDCICPDPHCGQRLIARNGGTRRIAHFAHESGSCTWSAEYVISMLAADIIKQSGYVVFPELTFFDATKHRDVVHAKSARVPVANAELREVSGRQAPDVVVTWKSGDARSERAFAIVFQLRHRVTDEQVQRLAEVAKGVIVIDLREHMRMAKKELDDKHFDRTEMLARYQSADFIRSVILEDGFEYATWAYSAQREYLHEDSVKRQEAIEQEKRKQWEADAEKRRKEQERLRKEREAKAALDAERRRLAEKERLKREEQRRREAAAREELLKKQREEAEKKAVEERRREEAMRKENDVKMLPVILPRMDQQEYPVEDEFGRRWVRCEKCGKVAPDREFAFYGGAGHINLGTCYECMRRG